MQNKDRTLIFDLDGTLIDSRKDLAQAVNSIRKEVGQPPLPIDVVVSYVGDGAIQLLERSLKDAPHIDPKSLLPQFRKTYEANLFEYTTLYDGVMQGLEKLHKANFKLALFSNKPHDACVMLMEHFKLSPMLSQIIGASDLFPLKPSGSAISHILKTNQSIPEFSMMIGDHHTDMNAGKEAGVKCAFARWGFGELANTKPDIFLNHFNDLLHILDVK